MKTILLNSFFLFFAIALNAQHPNMYVADIFDQSWIEKNKINSMSSQTLLRKSKENFQFNHLKKHHYHFEKGIKISDSAKSVQIKDSQISEKIGRGGAISNTYQLNSDNSLLEYYNMNDALHTYYFYQEDGSIEYTVVDATPLIGIEKAKAVKMTLYQLYEYQRDASGRVIKKTQYTSEESLKDIRTDLAAIKQKSLKVDKIWEYTYDDQNRLKQIKVAHKKPRKEERVIEYLSLKYNDQNLPTEFTHYYGSGNKTPSEISSIRKFEYTQS